MRWPGIAGMALLAGALAAGEARAHAFLDHAVPAVGATLAAPPNEIRIFFSEALEPAFSGLRLSRDGQPVPIGPVTVDPANRAALVASLPPLGPGRYRVEWHVVSVDTHRTEGAYTFEVRP